MRAGRKILAAESTIVPRVFSTWAWLALGDVLTCLNTTILSACLIASNGPVKTITVEKRVANG